MDLTPCGALMQRAQRGDRAAYDALLRECEAWLRLYLGHRLTPDHASDAAQEVLLAVHAKRHTYDPRRPFGPWLAGIARYKLMDRLRAAYKEGSVELTDQGRTESHEGAVLSGVLLGRLLDRLPPAQAEAIRLIKIEGLSVREASETTGQGESLLKVNVHRGRKAMLRMVEADDA